MHHLSIQTSLTPVFSDSRTHPPHGITLRYPSASRNVRLARASPTGGIISPSEDGIRCAVAGTEDLRILRVSDLDDPNPNVQHRSNVGQGGYRLDASRNMWDATVLKSDSSVTDVEWAHGQFNHKILTSARNGELIMWDLNKSGPSKYECKAKDHTRSVHKLAVSPIVHHYCITASADGDLRAWDIREIQKSRMRIHHPTGIRGIAFSPSPSQPLQAIVGLDNGSIYRWDLRMGQRGLLDRLLVAHTASVTSLDWYLPDGNESHANDGASGLGWIVSCGLDRTVKVWDVSHPSTSANTSVSAGHIPQKPTYTLHPGNFSEPPGPTTPTYASALGVGSSKGRHIPQHTDSSGASKTGRDRGALGTGDAVEIWDVRRGWIAKWTVRGSAIEGGVTDIAFRDSHAIWATHSSGMFSQIDLRDATKPIDAIPRVSVTWEASGTLAFVADRKLGWEVPYDDIDPASQTVADTRRKMKHVKSIGDAPCKPKNQAVGTYTSDQLPGEVEVFAKLARGYLFEGDGRRELCEINAQVSCTAGRIRVAQMWLLLGSALRPVIPAPPSLAPIPVLTPAAIVPNYAFPPLPNGNTADANASPGRSSLIASPHDRSSSTSRKLTPTSSNQSSPRLPVGSLPPVTPKATSRPALLARRQSSDSGAGSRRPSHYRRPSASTSLPGTANASPSNTRHVGEGALDDSDSSSGSEGSTGVDVGDEMTNDDGLSSGSENDNDKATVSPSLVPTRMMSASRSHPSPLSKIVELNWPENEAGEQLDDDVASSPSPTSTDTDKSTDEGSGLPRANRFKSPLRRHQKSKSSGSASSRRRSVVGSKSRSRSSTLASLAAPTGPRTLVHQSSHSSILTVTAGEISFQEATNTIRDLRSTARVQPPSAPNDALDDKDAESDEQLLVDDSKLTERRMEFVRAEEARMHDMTWDVIRDMLESFADEGDVQTCAMLALIAPEELRISPRRTLRFLEAYIDLLGRLQLHSCAAYVRKFCRTQDVYKSTLMETQIHTSCGKCRKPLVVSAGSPAAGQLVKGGFAFCIACKSSCVTCAICRLPVRTLFFQCATCQHGGHQACYRRHYMEQKMVPIPRSSVLENRGRRARDDDDGTMLETLQGHPCAAGCGHFCWAAI
ncbi:hypothetical protein C8F01DRAFT_1132786 [Mycena amicta]|nr:hypothetical protein C8F01DRAFT_1132786 [Mycena amicta]